MEPALSSSTRALLVAGAVAAVLFVVVFTVEGATRHGYSAARQPVSALALGPRGWLQITSFVVAGTGFAAFALGVRAVLRGGGAASWGTALLLVFAVGLVASGLFVMDPIPPPGEDPVGTSTWHGVLHDVAGLVVFTTLPAAAVVLSTHFWSVPGLRWLGVVSLVAGITCAAAFVAFSVALETGGASAGVLQRISIVVGWSWIALVAVALLTAQQDGAR